MVNNCIEVLTSLSRYFSLLNYLHGVPQARSEEINVSSCAFYLFLLPSLFKVNVCFHKEPKTMQLMKPIVSLVSLIDMYCLPETKMVFFSLKVDRF